MQDADNSLPQAADGLCSRKALAELSVIVVTWNGDGLLRDCLDSMRLACGDLPEIVVVDNAASESCRSLVAAYPNAKYVPSPGNPGFAGGNNIGLRHCSRKYVALLNNDTVVREDPFSRIVAYLESHPEVGVVQGTLRLSLVGDVLDDCGVMLTPFGVQYHRRYSKPTSASQSASGVVLAGKGALLVFSRALVADELGGTLFYDSFESYYEETDFCHRVWLAGREVHYVATHPVDHLFGQTSSKLNHRAVWTQCLANIMFSYATLLSPYGKLRLLPGFAALNFLNAMKGALVGDVNGFRAIWRAFAVNRARRSEIAAVRRQVQASRKISDRELFRRVLVHPPFRYYWLSAAGRLAEFSE